MPKACIFDFDGIIADTEALHYQSYQKVLDPLGAGFSWEFYQANYMAFDSRQAFDAALKVAQVENPPSIPELLELKMQAHEDLISNLEMSPLPGAVEAVHLAVKQGPVALCTGAQRRDVEPLLIAFGLYDHFTAIVTADDVSISKPNPECYLLAASQLGMEPSNCLAIEDTPGGLSAARAAGCKTLGVTTTHSREQLLDYADQVTDSLLNFSSFL